jgi:hypothetical protein
MGGNRNAFRILVLKPADAKPVEAYSIQAAQVDVADSLQTFPSS